jgi:hypothetical protein
LVREVVTASSPTVLEDITWWIRRQKRPLTTRMASSMTSAGKSLKKWTTASEGGGNMTASDYQEWGVAEPKEEPVYFFDSDEHSLRVYANPPRIFWCDGPRSCITGLDSVEDGLQQLKEYEADQMALYGEVGTNVRKNY